MPGGPRLRALDAARPRDALAWLRARGYAAEGQSARGAPGQGAGHGGHEGPGGGAGGEGRGGARPAAKAHLAAPSLIFEA